MGIIYNIGDSGDDAKVCVMEAPANEDNELDTLLLLGQVGGNIRVMIIIMFVMVGTKDKDHHEQCQYIIMITNIMNISIKS